MSLALIEESAKEVRRLAIAGSPLAVGDFRLKKLIPPLEQAGAKVPVFGQVAKATGDLVNGSEADSPAHLLNLSTLLNAILYTQGQTSAEGPLRELETFSTSLPATRTSARVMKPVIQALTTGGGGRFEIVRSAVERGAFNDLRLIEPAIRALEDNYPELADLMAERVLPKYGPGIAPLLKRNLDIKGKKSDARRLGVLHELDPAGTLELCKTALEEGSADVKITAIQCLGKHEEGVPLLMEQAKAKNKAVREAALEALAQHDRPETSNVFIEMLRGKAVDLLAGPLRRVKSRAVSQLLLQEARATLETILKSDGAAITRFLQLLDCLQGRKDAQTQEFLVTAFAEADKLVKVKAPKATVIAGVDLVREMTELLYALGTPQALNAILSQREQVPPDSFGLVFKSALQVWSPDKVYQEFAPLLGQKKGKGRDKGDEMARVIMASRWQEDSEFEVLDEEEAVDAEAQALRKVEWDPRWVDTAIKAEQQVIVCCLATPGSKAAIAYLLKKLEDKKAEQAALIIQALARCQYPKVTEAFLDLVARKAKNARYFDYELQLLFNRARYLPPADLPKLEAFAAHLDEKYVDKFLEAIEPLRLSKQPAQP